MSLPRHITTAIRKGQHDNARQGFLEWLEDHPAPADPLDAARVAQQLGLLPQALDILRHALDSRPHHEEIRMELADLLDDLGHTTEADALRTPPDGSTPADLPAEPFLHRTQDRASSPDAPERDGGHATVPPHDDADLVRMHQLFSGREDVHARQWTDADRGTGYAPIRKPLTPELLRAHLHGSATLGVYPIRLDGTVTFVALDLDLTRRALDDAAGSRAATRRLRAIVHEEGLRLRDTARALGIPGLLFDSGYKGRHLWIFLKEPAPSALAHRFGNALAHHLAPTAPELVLEVFPRQAHVRNDGLGNLIKIPLGIHLHTGRRAALLREDGQPDPQPFRTLHLCPRLDRETLLDVFSALGPVPESRRPPQRPATSDNQTPPIEGTPPPPPFAETDLESRPALATLLKGCAVLDALVRRALEKRRLDHNERVVLRHAMGHLPDGVEAVNYIFARCPEVPPDAHLGRRLAGSPISCARVRQRIPHITSGLPCNCAFPDHPDRYPTPVLHAEGIAPGQPPPAKPDPEAVARSWVALNERRSRIDAEMRQHRDHFIEALKRCPDHSLRVRGGTWTLVHEQGLPVLNWQPDIGPEPGHDLPEELGEPAPPEAGPGPEHASGAPPADHPSTDATPATTAAEPAESREET